MVCLLIFFSSGTYASAMGKYWHVHHLLCSRCNRALGGDGSFRMDEGEIICRVCFENSVAKICAKCNQAILSVSVGKEFRPSVNFRYFPVVKRHMKINPKCTLYIYLYIMCT